MLSMYNDNKVFPLLYNILDMGKLMHMEMQHMVMDTTICTNQLGMALTQNMGMATIME